MTITDTRPQTNLAAANAIGSRVAIGIALCLAGLSAGFFFTYEWSVTLGLAQVSDLTYVETFQAINDTVRNPQFGTVFFGSIPAIASAAALNWGRSSTNRRMLFVVSLGLYLLGVAITFMGNVTLNRELAEYTDLTRSIAGQARGNFEADWNRYNLVRTLAFIGSFGALIAASVVPGRTTRQTG